MPIFEDNGKGASPHQGRKRGSTPTEEADVEQLNILQSWLAEGGLEGI